MGKVYSMTVKYLDSKRISALSSDFPTTTTTYDHIGDTNNSGFHAINTAGGHDGTKVGIKIIAGSPAIGTKIEYVSMSIRKWSGSTGNYVFQVIDGTDGTTVLASATSSASALTETAATVELQLDSVVTLSVNDRIVLSYPDGSGSNIVGLARNSATTESGYNRSILGYSTTTWTDSTTDNMIMTFDSSPVSISKPTNVQDNSILVEKDTGKRYWSSGYGTGGAITKDSSVNAQTATSGSTLTASLTVASNSNRIIIISLTSYIDPALVPTGITFGSQAFTKLDSYGDTNGNGSVWYLVNPNVGTDTVTATWASSIGKRGFTAYSFYNVAQTNPLSGFTTATGTGNTATGSITPTTAGSAIFSSLSWILGYSVNARPVSTLDYEYYIYTGGKTGGSSYNLTPTISSSNAMNYTNIDDNGSTSTSAHYRIGMMEIKKGNSTWTWDKEPVYLGRGIFASGISSNVIDYITIATTGNATDFGDSLKTQHDGSAVGSLLRAVFGGGTGTTADTKLEYISFQTLGNAVGFGAMLSGIGGNSAACGDGSRGIWGQNTAMQYITIDTAATAISFGTLGNNHGSDPASCADDTRGVWGGGEPSADTNAISYVTIQTTGNSTDFGDLVVARRQFSAVADATRGCFGGGYDGGYCNNIDYITIQTTGNASDFGDLTVPRVTASGACGDATRGVWGGGDNGSNINTIDYVTIATTGNASDFGDLTVARHRTNGASDYVK